MRWGWLNSEVVSTKRPSAWRRLGIAALAAVGIAGVSGRLSAQTTATITGVVTEAGSNNPLVGASVRVTGTQIGAQTGDDGRYTVRGVQAGTVDLQVNRIGYEVKHQRVTVTAGQTATVNVTLSQAAFSLAEVVTTVTGAQSKAEISNTVATIDVASKIPEAAVTSTGQLLSGRASGVQVLSSGDVGSGSRIRIRGQSSLSLGNDPIVYVDGIRVDGGATNTSGTGGTRQSALDQIAPEEIETIDVIKGPAAATLYGTQAANGVILITTKKGHAGTTKYNAFAEAGNMWDPNKGKYDDLYISFDTSKLDKNGRVAACTLQQDAAGSCTIDSTFHHNVLNDPITTPLATGNRQQYGLQVSGGAEKLQYFISGDLQHEQGPYKMPGIEVARLSAERGSTIGDDQLYPNAHKQVNLRTNLNSQFTSKADLNVSVAYIDDFVRQPQNNDNSDGLMVDALGGTARTDLTDARGVPLLGYRSFPMGDIFAQRQTFATNRFVNGLTTHYYPWSWLNARANFGYDYSSRHELYLQEFNQGPYGETDRGGYVEDLRGENAIYTLDGGLTATYSPKPKFGTKTSVGVQYYRSFFSRTTGTGQGLTPGATTTSGAAIRASSQSTTESITLGGYGEEVLSYAERIFLTGGLRYDGNSAFGSNFSGVFYPKIGLSWLLSDESFFPKINALNSFRLRATYGSSGVQPGTTDALRYYSAIGANIGGTENSAVTLGALGNSNLKPEYSGEFEAGFDATAFSNKTTVELTYYNKKTKDALIKAPLAPSLGGSITSELENLGSTRNQGLELTWNQNIIDNNQVGLEFQLTGSTNKNEILALGQGITPISTGNRNTQYNAPGYPLFGLWGKQISYNDANGDGLLVPSEVSVSDTAVFWGPSFPTHELAFSPRLELLHRKLAISAQFDHKDGMTKFWNTLRHRCQGGQSCPGLWDPNASLYTQAAAIAVNSYSTYSGYFFNGEFTRFRELAVTYDLPERLAHALHTDRAQIIGTGRNLAVWSPYPGTDPEAGVGINDDRGNEEYFSTPPLRFFTLRLNLNF